MKMKNPSVDDVCISKENCEGISSEKISKKNNLGNHAEGESEKLTVEANCEIVEEQQELTKISQDSLNKSVDENDEESCLIRKIEKTRIIDLEDESFEDNKRSSKENIQESCQKKEVRTKSNTSKKKTKNQIKEERLKIHSETHRLMRERHIAIPYHLPKQRTLKEFLSRKKNRANIPLNTPSFKMVEIWKDIEESTKTASEFFKSDSDSDSEVSRKGIESKKHKKKSQKRENKFVTCDDANNKRNTDEIENGPHCNSNSDKEDNCSNINNDDVENSPRLHEPLTDEENNTEKENEDKHEESVAVDEHEENAEVVPCKSVGEGRNGQSNSGKTSENSNSNQCFDTEIPQSVDELNSDDSYTKMKTLEWVKKIPVYEKSVKPNKKEMLLKKINPTLLEITPKLSGESDSVIDLENVGNDIEIGAKKLKKRFFKNCLPPSQPKKNEVELILTMTENNGKGEISNVTAEKLIYQSTQSFDGIKCEKPGAKLQRLREELQRKIEEKWEEEYKRQTMESHLEACKRGKEMIEDEEELLEDRDLTDSLSSESENDCEEDDDKVDDEDGEDDEDDDEDVDDDEDDDEDVDDKLKRKKKKNMFIDNEAEESGCEESGNEGGYELAEEEDGYEDEDEDGSDSDSVRAIANENSGVHKSIPAETEEMFDKDSNSVNAYDTQSSQIAPYQPGGGMLNGGSELSQCDDDICFPKSILSPTLKLSMDFLSNSKNSASQQSWDLDLEVPEVNSNRANFIPRFPENENFDLSDAYEFCSGKFPDNPVQSQGATMDSQGSVTSESNEFGFNSGVIIARNTSFEYEDSKKDEVDRREENLVSRLKVVNDDSEEENEIQNTRGNELEDITGKRLSSDDSDNGSEKSFVVKNKKTWKHLHFSDEEESEGGKGASDSEDEPQEEENLDGRDNFSESEVEYFEEDSARKVEYNSEEEEIVNPKEFFEKEAELSGSEWSGDEDERDLDKMEEEDGDDDKLDNRKVRSQLEKIHIRTLLDDDARQVRVLQELLFEDGDLFDDGPKRERNFRWKDLGAFFDDDGNGGDANIPQDQEEVQEDEQSTKQRHEKELFLLNLKNKKEESGLDEDENDGLSLLKPGRVVLKTSMKSNIVREEKVVRNNSNVVESVDFKASGQLSIKRGSFLSRNEEFLSRLAKFTSNATDNILGPKHSKNFVFAAKSPEKTNNSSKENSHPKRRDVSPQSGGQRKKKAKIYDEITHQKASVLDRLV